MQRLTTPKVAKETFEAMNGGLATPGVAKWAEYGFEEENAAINHSKGG